MLSMNYISLKENQVLCLRLRLTTNCIKVHSIVTSTTAVIVSTKYQHFNSILITSNKMSAPAIIPIVTRISSRIIRILGCNPGPMTLQGTNTYLLGTSKKRILLDTGDADHSIYIDNLREVLKNENASIDTILLTHWHHDHIGGVKDILTMIGGNNDCKIWKFPRTDAADIYEDIPKNVEIQKLLDGQEFSVEGATVKVVHTPGHTTDHVILTMKEDNSLFSGDCILGEGTAVFEDLYDYMKSLTLILTKKPSVIYPGHGNIIEDPLLKIQYYIDHRNQREAQILKVFKENPTENFNEMDLVKRIYIDTPETLWPAAAYNVNHHLTKLTKENLLEQIGKTDNAVWHLNVASKM